MKKLTLLTLLSAFFAFAPAAHAVVYTGELHTTDGVEGSGIWQDNFKISWEVASQLDGSWKYTYRLTETDGSVLEPGAVSHWIIEISPNAADANFWGFQGNHEIATYSVDSNGKSNPNMPGPLYGLKLDYTATEYSFFSNKVPVWGDFYGKDGKAAGKGDNAAWNADYLLADPTAAAQSGLLAKSGGGYYYKLLRPDSLTTTSGPTPSAPEPTTIFLVATGLLGAGFTRRFKKN